MTAHVYDKPDPVAKEALRPPLEPLSETLRKLPELPVEPLTVRDIANAVADRSLGAILALFAIMNCIPAPPGTSLILGLPVPLKIMPETGDRAGIRPGRLQLIPDR